MSGAANGFASVAFPLYANEETLLMLADNLSRFHEVINYSHDEFVSVASYADREWIGESGSAFSQHIRDRAKSVKGVGQPLPTAASAIREYVAALKTCKASYKNHAAAERAINPQGGMFYARSQQQAWAWNDAIQGQKAAADALNQAADACAAVITQAVQAIMPFLTEKYRAATAIREGKEPVEQFGNVIDGADYAAGQNRRTGAQTGNSKPTPQQINRWDPSFRTNPGYVGKYSFEEFMAKMRLLRYLTKPIEIAGFGLTLRAQYLEDFDLNFTDNQRIERIAAAGVFESGGSFLGGLVGRVGGGAAGSSVGPGGTAVGAVGGAVAGAQVGGDLGRAGKERLFDKNPGGRYR